MADPTAARLAKEDIAAVSQSAISLRSRMTHHSVRRLATTHHSFLGSFSSVSKRNFASKYAFCSIFQNLQNFLPEFSKKYKILQKFAKFCKISQNSAFFLETSPLRDRGAIRAAARAGGLKEQAVNYGCPQQQAVLNCVGKVFCECVVDWHCGSAMTNAKR